MHGPTARVPGGVGLLDVSRDSHCDTVLFREAYERGETIMKMKIVTGSGVATVIGLLLVCMAVTPVSAENGQISTVNIEGNSLLIDEIEGVNCTASGVTSIDSIVPTASADPDSLYTGENQNVFILGDLSHPITLEQISEERDGVINEYKSTSRSAEITGLEKKPIIEFDPEVPEGFSIVAYAYTINSDGISNQYTGITKDNESVSIIRDNAKKWYKKYVLNDSLEQLTSSTMRSDDWIFVGRGYDDLYESPYGGVVNNHELYWHPNDNDPQKEWFLIKQIFAMEPGVQKYSSSYYNQWGVMEHNWAAGTMGNPALFDWDPLSTVTGEQTVSISISGGTGGASITKQWSYTQADVSTTCQSSTNTDIAKWTMSCNSDAAKSNTVGMKPGSTCSVNQHSSGTYRLADLISKGKFLSSIPPGTRILEHTMHVSYRY